MTDETPQPEGTPSPATPEEQPTAETKPFTYDDAVAQAGDEDDVAPAPPPAAEAPTQAAPAPGYAAAAPAAAPAAATTDRPAGIFIPKWLGIVAAAIVAALIFGGIGYAIGDSSGSDSSNASNVVPGNGAQRFPGGTLPNGGQFPGNGEFPGTGNPNGNGNQNGGGTTATNAGFLGVGVQTASDNKGVEVTQVAANSPAAKAGLQTGDEITAINGNDITSAAALRDAIQAKQSGDQISVTYTRNGSSNTVQVTLTSRAAAQSS